MTRAAWLCLHDPYPYSGTSRLVWVMSCSWWWQRVRGNVETCKGFWSQGSKWCIIISAYLLLDKASHKDNPDSRGRGSKIYLFSERNSSHVAKGMVWIQGEAKNRGPSCHLSAMPRHCSRCWQDISEQSRLKFLPLGSSLWWWWRGRIRDNFVQSLRRPVATVSSTWTCGAVIGTISAAFGTLRGPASLSAMGGGMQCREGIQPSGGVWRGMLSSQGPSILLICLFTRIKLAAPTFAKWRLF